MTHRYKKWNNNKKKNSDTDTDFSLYILSSFSTVSVQSLQLLIYTSSCPSPSGWVMAVLLLYVFFPTMGKSEHLNTLSEKLYLHGMDKPRIFGILKQILLMTRTEFFKTHKPGISLKKDQCYPSLYSSLSIFNTVIQLAE